MRFRGIAGRVRICRTPVGSRKRPPPHRNATGDGSGTAEGVVGMPAAVETPLIRFCRMSASAEDRSGDLCHEAVAEVFPNVAKMCTRELAFQTKDSV
jgi:hypothetical protein